MIRFARARPAAVVASITAIEPNDGASAGGDTVRIHMTRVRSGATCTIGGASATVVGGSYTSPGHIDVTTPAHAAGAVDVVVTDYHGIATEEDGFEFIDGGAAPATDVFKSAFSTALGNSNDALLDTDGDGWDSIANFHEGVLEVISNAGLGFPAGLDNCVQVKLIHRATGGGFAMNLRKTYSTPVLQNDGDKYTLRWYERVIADPWPSSDVQNHGIENGNGNQNWDRQTNVAGSGTWDLKFGVGGMSWPDNRWVATLIKGHTYRVEVQFTRLSSGTFTLVPRVYNESGTLVKQASDFVNVNGSNHLGNLPVLDFIGVATMDDLQVGHNGTSTGSGVTDGNDDVVHSYFGAFRAVTGDEWPGAFSVEELP